MGIWDSKHVVSEYQQWTNSPAGGLALQAKIKLISDLMSGWPRRGRSILEIGCATGLLTEMFYHAGFDVTGIDSSSQMLVAARERMQGRADLHLGNAERLPFEDNQFDFVSVGSVLEHVDEPELVLSEALRVASRAVVVTVYSTWSIYYTCRDRNASTGADRRNALSPLAVNKMLRDLAGDRDVIRRSILIGPVSTWKEAPFWKWLNSRILPYGFGALSGIQIDVCDTKITIPLMAKRCGTKPAILNACRTNIAARESSSSFDK